MTKHLPLFVVLVLFAARADASSITYLYTGSIGQTFNESIVARDTPATILLTIDDRNLQLGAPYRPEGGAAYHIHALVSFLDRAYDISGIFELNWDAAYGYYNLGIIRLLMFGYSGPSLLDAGTSWAPRLVCGYPPCGLQVGTTDPNSPVFDAQSLSFRLDFRGDCSFMNCPGGGALQVNVSQPVAMPEPTTLVMLGLGFIGVRALVKR